MNSANNSTASGCHIVPDVYIRMYIYVYTFSQTRIYPALLPNGI